MSAFPFQNAPPPGARGFSIVELVLAIAIVAVLATLLGAAFRESREKVNTVKCMANLRSLTTAARLYANDHDGNFTYRDFMHGTGDVNKTTGAPEAGFREYVGLPNRSVGINTVFTCPTLQRKYPTIKYAENRNYVINRYATVDYAKRVYKKFPTVPRPAVMAYLMDGRIAEKEADGYSFYSHISPGEADQLLSPHNGFNHVAFLDGHVEAFTGKKLSEIPTSAAFWTGETP